MDRLSKAIDPRAHVEALREVCMMKSAVCPSRRMCGGTVTQRGDDGLQRPSRRPVRRFGGVRAGDCDRVSRDPCDQVHAVVQIDEERGRLHIISTRSSITLV